MNSRSTVIDVLRTAGCVFAEDEADLLISTATTPAALTAMIDRRVEGVPLEQIVGWALFRELRVSLDPGVFVPRRRSEFLVEEALKLVPRPAVVVDLCCGSGALGIALAAASDDVELVAADVEPAAVRCARRNVEAVGGRVFEETCSNRCRRTSRGESTYCWPTCRTYRPRRSPSCHRRPGCTSRASRWMAAWTVSTYSVGLPPRRLRGLRMAGTCWSRRVTVRPLKPSR